MDPDSTAHPQPDVFLFGDPALRLFGGSETPTSIEPANLGDVGAA